MGPSSMNRNGRALGMVVFVLGIAILLFVFATAYVMFAAPSAQALGSSGGAPPSAAGLGGTVVWLLVRVGLLFIMTLAGSLIAGRGIQLYLGSGETKK
jgi:hypothetical protein